MPVLPAAPRADQRYEVVARTLAWAIVVFSWLTAAEVSDAAWWIYEPHGKLWCGNVVSDPLYLELNLLVPLAFVSALADIKGDKLWIQRDGTEHGVARELLEAGVPKNHIVLAFRSPELRRSTDFAVA